ncbi:MORN repeat-containing protein [Winogradskyella sp. HB-48]|uniref:MORN repeat-containing protein n=1 Tax=Winogradskyella sp. HB-48 TaxID=3416808 RepID=UPI003CF99A25
MKKIALSFFAVWFVILVFSQEAPTYNSEMGIQPYIATDDFGVVFDIESLLYPVEFTETSLKDEVGSMDRIQKTMSTQMTYKINKLGHIEEEKIKSSYSNIDLTRKYFYDDKGKLTKIQFYEGNDPTNEYTTYQYHDSRVVKTISNVVNDKVNERNFLKLDDNRYQSESDQAIFTYFIVSTIGKKVRSIKTKNKQTGKESEIKYGFYTDAYGQNEKITYETGTIDKIYTFEPNQINRLSKIVTTNLQTKKKTYKFYTYLNDAFGNWIIRYENSEGEEWHENVDQVRIRQYTYPDGTVTGYTDPNNPEFKAWLKDYYFKNFRKKMSNDEVPDGYVWKKNTDGSTYWFMINGKNISGECHSYFVGDNLVVFHKTSGKLYSCKDFNIQTANVFHNAEVLNVDTKLGFWYKPGEKGVKVFDENGNLMSETEIYKFATNNKDVLFKGKNKAKTVLLKDYPTVTPYIIYPVYDSEKSIANAYDDAAKALQSQTESVIGMVESMDEVYKKVAGECIEGNCENGYGEKKWSSGNEVNAFFENGKPKGPGFIIYSDGTQRLAIYNGSWDNVEGFEYAYFKSGNSQFVDRKTNRGFYFNSKNNELGVLDLNKKQKTILQPNNDNYCMIGDCRDGVGIYKYSNGTVYMGTFKNGTIHGFGELSFTNGQYYIGEFLNNKKEGLGSYVWGEYYNYTGEWRNDTYHGKGIMTYSKDNYKAGLWQDGQYANGLNTENLQSQQNLKASSTSNYKSSTITLTAQEETEIKNCNGDTKCLGGLCDEKYLSESKTKKGDALNQAMADYLVGINNIIPGKLFGTMVKSDYLDISAVRTKLPKEVQDELANQGRNLINEYNKQMNSEETRKNVEKHGGTVKKGN